MSLYTHTNNVVVIALYPTKLRRRAAPLQDRLHWATGIEIRYTSFVTEMQVDAFCPNGLAGAQGSRTRLTAMAGEISANAAGFGVYVRRGPGRLPRLDVQ